MNFIQETLIFWLVLIVLENRLYYWKSTQIVACHYKRL